MAQSKNPMINCKYILLISFVLAVGTVSAQQVSSERLDTTISIFWNPNLKQNINCTTFTQQQIG